MQIRFNEKEKKIIECIEKITGVKPNIGKELTDYKSFHIKQILILSSSYHYFQLEEEGRLKAFLNEWYFNILNEKPPEIIHVETQNECIEFLNLNKVDLIIIFDEPENSKILTLAKKIKEISKAPIVLIGNNIAKLSKILEKDNQKLLTKVLTWNGDGKIILAITQLIEDKHTIKQNKLFAKKCKILLLIEDSIQYYSTYLLLIYDEILDFLNVTMQNSISTAHRKQRLYQKPVVLHAINLEEGKNLYNLYKKNLIGIITDNEINNSIKKGKQAGYEFALQVSKEKPDLPILIQSSEPVKFKEPLKKNIEFVSKKNTTIVLIIKDFVNKCLGPRYIQVKDSNGKDIFLIKNLSDLEEAVLSVEEKILTELAHKNLFSKWLNAKGEIELAKKIYLAEIEVNKISWFRKKIIDILEEYKYAQTQTVVSPFERNSLALHFEINRIGNGALGGKARGLSFLAKLISKYISENMFSNLRITVPRTIVISTDIFDSFILQNKLNDPKIYDLSDERIALKFISGSLPAVVLGDLRAFIQKTRKPLVVRSSSMLEDSLLQPFAGIYDSVLLPNESWETDFRFQEVCNAIKYVYASTFFEKARTYIKSTPKNINDEKMAVIIQEVVGQKHENYFYPIISGVAKSYNYYPISGCKPEDGIVYLALGLGKAIVDGMCSFCFCPEHPLTPLSGTPKDFIRYSQRRLYALNLKSIYTIVERNVETSYSILNLEDVKRHGLLDKVASTYNPQDDRICPGIYEEGSIVIDFAPVLQYETLPLVKALKLLLRICETALGYPVEIEFALNIEEKDFEKAELVILQIRSMLQIGKFTDIIVEQYNPDKDICYCENALGNGIIEGVRDIVYVKSTFEMSNSIRAVGQIRKLNKKLINEKKTYILIGPGRWGSADHWLGIPVIWSDIAGAKVIVEIPFKERTIDPSQGSHFFHDLVSSQVGYLITKKEKGNIDYKWLDSLPVIDEFEDIKHVETPYPLIIKIDGKHGKAVIRQGKGINKSNKIG